MNAETCDIYGLVCLFRSKTRTLFFVSRSSQTNFQLSCCDVGQFADTDPLAQETLEAVQAKLPEIIDLCKKYDVNYHFDEKTTKLLMGNSK